MKAFFTLIKRDIRLSFSKGSDAMVTLFFFILVASLFPFALGGESLMIKKAAAGIIWVSALLSALLSLENIYHRDYEDGTFDLMMLSPISPFLVVCAKIFSHWLVSGLVLVIASIFVSQMLFIPFELLWILLTSLFLGTIYMSLLGSFGAILTFGTKRPGLLLALLILPLYIPMLILGIMAMEAGVAGLPVNSYLLLQLSMVIAALPLTSWVGAIFLRMNMRS